MVGGLVVVLAGMVVVVWFAPDVGSVAGEPVEEVSVAEPPHAVATRAIVKEKARTLDVLIYRSSWFGRS